VTYGPADRLTLAGVFDGRATLLGSDCASGPRSLVSVDLATGRAAVLLGPGLNGGSVR